MMARFPLTRPPPASAPGIASLRGIIFQSDAASWLGTALIRPAEHLDQWWAGLYERKAGAEGNPSPLAMHAGLHVVIADGREFVVEQLSGGWRELFVNGRHWTPLEAFRARDHCLLLLLAGAAVIAILAPLGVATTTGQRRPAPRQR